MTHTGTLGFDVGNAEGSELPVNDLPHLIALGAASFTPFR